MKKQILMAALALCAGAASAGSLDIYAGTRMGLQHSDVRVDGARAFDQNGGTSSFFVGRQVTSKCAVEVSATDYAKLELVDAAGRNTSVWGRSLSMEGVYKLHSHGPWSVKTSLGLAYTKASLARDKVDRLSPVFGASVEYNVSPNTFVEAGWRHVHGLGVASNQADSFTVGVGFRF